MTNTEYKKIEEKEADKNQPSGLKKSSCVRRHLRLVPQKRMAVDLEVSTQTINQWVHGKPIPADRMFEILKSAKGYYREIRQMEDEIDMMMILQFGRGDD